MLLHILFQILDNIAEAASIFFVRFDQGLVSVENKLRPLLLGM
jgi:hypothetical protein